MLPQDVPVEVVDGLELGAALVAGKLRHLHALVLRIVPVGDVLQQIFVGGRPEVAARALQALREVRQHVLHHIALLASAVAAHVAEELFDLLMHGVDVLSQALLELAAERTNSAGRKT